MKKEEIMKDDYEILATSDNFPPSHKEIVGATRKKDGRREQYWIKTASVPKSEGMEEKTFIIKKNK